MDAIQLQIDAIETARLDVVDKFSLHLMAEVTLARQNGGFFDKKYWGEFLYTKLQWQQASNNFDNLLHELAK